MKIYKQLKQPVHASNCSVKPLLKHQPSSGRLDIWALMISGIHDTRRCVLQPKAAAHSCLVLVDSGQDLSTAVSWPDEVPVTLEAKEVSGLSAAGVTLHGVLVHSFRLTFMRHLVFLHNSDGVSGSHHAALYPGPLLSALGLF